MFWGSFSYDKKGPCHIWKAETPKEKKEADTWLTEETRFLSLSAKQNRSLKQQCA